MTDQFRQVDRRVLFGQLVDVDADGKTVLPPVDDTFRHQQQVWDGIVRWGHMVITDQLPPAGPAVPPVPYAITAGLTFDKAPELCCYGVPVRAATTFLNSLAEHQPRAGWFSGPPFVPGIRALLIPVLADAGKMHAVSVPKLIQREIELLQVVVPDRFGRFPWDHDYRHGKAQPVFGPIPPEAQWRAW